MSESSFAARSNVMDACDLKQPILILASEDCSYPGANSVGQAHLSYPENTYIIRTPTPALFPEKFFLDCFDKGIGGIVVMSCGVECPYEGAYPALAKRVDRIYAAMKKKGLDIRRLRLTAICTVCNRAFLNEVKQMSQVVAGLGAPGSEARAA